MGADGAEGMTYPRSALRAVQLPDITGKVRGDYWSIVAPDPNGDPDVPFIVGHGVTEAEAWADAAGWIAPSEEQNLLPFGN